MTETEKVCFEFCSKSEERVPDEMAGFRQDLGWHTTSRQKSEFLSHKHGIGSRTFELVNSQPLADSAVGM